jgi:hypothetical protein
MRSIAALCVVACALAACTRAGGDAKGADLARFTLGDEPILVLEEDGTQEKLFSRVNARRTEAGEVVVSDAISLSVNVFGADGTLMRQLAKKGAGPGELENVAAIQLHADTLLTFLNSPGAPPDVNVFTVGGGFVRRLRPSTPRGEPPGVAVAYMGKGSFLMQRGRGFTMIPALPEPPGLVPDSATFGILGTGDESGDTTFVWLPSLHHGDLFTFHWPGGVVPVTFSLLEIGHRTFPVTSGDILWVAESGTGVIRGYGATGELVVDAKLSRESRTFEDRELAEARDAALTRAPSARDTLRVRAMYDRSVLPPTMPLFDAAIAGPDGELWLRLFSLEPGVQQRFVAIGRNGNEIGEVLVPADLLVQQFGGDFMLGIRRDELDVPSVVVYAMTRG